MEKERRWEQEKRNFLKEKNELRWSGCQKRTGETEISRTFSACFGVIPGSCF